MKAQKDEDPIEGLGIYYGKINNYVENESKKLEKSEKNLKDLKNYLKNFCKITDEYSNKISKLGTELVPDQLSIIGRFIQIIQNITLFNSLILKELSTNIEKKICKIEDKKKNHSIELYNNFQKFSVSCSNIIQNYSSYNDKIEKYEKYLMNEEMGFSNNDKNEDLLKDINGMESKYKTDVNNLKEVVDKLLNYGLNEENLLYNEYKNICKTLFDDLNNSLEKMKENNKNEYDNITKLNEDIESEQKNYKENLKFTEYKYPLLSLKIYAQNKSIIITKKSKKEDNLKKELEIYKDITLEKVENIMKKLKEIKIEIRDQDLKGLEKQRVKDFIEKKCKLINSKEEKISEEDKNKLIKYFEEDKEYISFFLTKLGVKRSAGYEIFNEDTYKAFGEILMFINDIGLKQNEYGLFDRVQLLGATFYKKEENKNIYLTDFIKKNEKLKNPKFWINYFEFALNKEPNKSIYSAIAFTCQIMIDFGFGRKFIDEFINSVKKNCKIPEKDLNLVSEWRKEVDGTIASD